MRHQVSGTSGVAAILLMLAGAALPAFGQDTPPSPPPPSPDSPATPPTQVPEPETAPDQPAPDPNDPATIEERIQKAARLREQLRQDRLAKQQGQVPPGNVPVRPGDLLDPAQQDGQAQPPAAVADLPVSPDGEQISLVFDGPVDLSAFVEFVARNLRINIIEDPGLAGKTVTFRAPLTIPREELLPLLAALVEDSGFALVQEDLGFYRVRPEGSIRPDFGGPLATTRIIRTPLVRPSVAAQTITQQIGGAGGTGGPGGVAAGPNFRMTPVDELGVIIATGPSGVLETIERFAKELVDESQSQQFTRIELRNVSASYARSRVIALNSGADATAAAGIQPVPGGASIAATTGLLGNLESRLYIDQGNALLFRGGPRETEMLRAMIAVLDEVTPLVVRRYVAGSVAMEAARAGERLGLGTVTLTGDTSMGGSSFRSTNPTLAPTGVRGAGGDTGVEPAASGFTVDPETGSLIYYGTEIQHERVQQLVEQFKLTAIGEDIEIRTYKLLYAKAEAADEEGATRGVVDILIDLLEDPTQQTTRSPFLPNQGGRGGRDVTIQPIDDTTDGPASEGATRLVATQENTIIVGDPDRNQVIIKAPRKAQEQFAEIIAKLDQKQPQVRIDVKIVSLTMTDSFDWEADVQLNFGQFSWFSGFGASIVEGAGTGAATTLDPRTLPATTPGLTTGWIKSDYLPIAIQTLARVGETKVLSEPSILVNDNQTAEFKSVREEPFSQASQGTSTTIVSQGGVAEAGTTLTVTPRISSGGDISIEYTVELSDFTGAASNGLQPPKQTDNYASSVTLPSDSTIVVGGFKLKRSGKSEAKIPFLGDIPLLGALFKSYNQAETDAVIFVFITPKVMRDPLGEDLRLATRGPMELMDVEPDVPDMDPAVIPILRSGAAPQDEFRSIEPPPATAETMPPAPERN